MALAEAVVIKMRLAAVREMRLNEEVSKPSLAEVLEFKGLTMDCSVESTPHEDACIYSSTYDGGELLKQFGEPAQTLATENVPTRSHGKFANTFNPWPRQEELEAKDVMEIQKRTPGNPRRQGNRWDQYGESSSASPSETHGMSDNSITTESPWGPWEAATKSQRAAQPYRLVTPDSHSRTSGVIVLQSGSRLPAAIVHGSRHQNGKAQRGPPRLSGP